MQEKPLVWNEGERAAGKHSSFLCKYVYVRSCSSDSLYSPLFNSRIVIATLTIRSLYASISFPIQFFGFSDPITLKLIENLPDYALAAADQN